MQTDKLSSLGWDFCYAFRRPIREWRVLYLDPLDSQ
jgi:hypothetical protein